MEIKDKELHRITSTAIIYKDGLPARFAARRAGEAGKYLILRRSLQKKAFPGKWTVPGGGLETDDYINLPASGAGQWYHAVEVSLRREIKEETGLEVGALNYLLDIAFIRPDGVPVVILSYWTNYKAGEVKLDEDSIDYAWVSYEEAKNYDLIDGILGEIEMVDNMLKGKNNV